MMGRRTANGLHPPLQGEGRTAEGSPGWGDPAAPSLRHPHYPHPARESGPTSPLQGEVKHAIFAANRAHGHVSLALAASSRGTRRTRTHEEGSLRVRFP